jgi:hypothetical protein
MQSASGSALAEPSLYQRKFFEAWEAYADDLKQIFSKGEPDIRALRDQYACAQS